MKELLNMLKENEVFASAFIAALCFALAAILMLLCWIFGWVVK